MHPVWLPLIVYGVSVLFIPSAIAIACIVENKQPPAPRKLLGIAVSWPLLVIFYIGWFIVYLVNTIFYNKWAEEDIEKEKEERKLRPKKRRRVSKTEPRMDD